jgi:hypothetical protein
MVNLAKTYLFRMVHIQNIAHILAHGITHSSSVNSNPAFLPIGDSSLISTRGRHLLSNGKQLGDYIPFYFGVKTPMLYVVQNGFNMVTPTSAENIVYCVSSIQQIINLNLNFVFTDGHAVDSFSTLYYPKDVQNIDTIIDWNSINAKYWRDENDLDRKRKKEAEFLILGDIPISAVLGYVVFNQNANNKLLALGVNQANIKIDPNFYF